MIVLLALKRAFWCALGERRDRERMHATLSVSVPAVPPWFFKNANDGDELETRRARSAPSFRTRGRWTRTYYVRAVGR